MPAFTKTLLTLLSASLLFGCSALDDDNDDSIAKTSLSGKVADGYLSGAKVCLDLNKNKVCDDGEPSTTSTTGGEFSLEGVTQQQLDTFPLLVEVVVGKTIDEDSPNTPIDKKYTLTAPAGYSFISPLTTMVQSEIEDNGVSAEAAKGSVQAKLGTTLDLGSDYVAGASAGDNSKEFSRLHKVARVTTIVLQDNIKLVEQLLVGKDVSFEDLVGLIVKKVLASLDTISNQVTAAGDNFDAADIAKSDAVKAANVDAATVEADIAEREAARKTIEANIASLFGSGASIHIFRAEEESSALIFGYETIKKSTDNFVKFLFTEYNSVTKAWDLQAEETKSSTEEICALESDGFICKPEKDETITIENNAVVVKVGGLSSTRTEITGVSVDLSGKVIQTFLPLEFNRVIKPKALFSTGSVGYKLSFKRTQNMHALFKAKVDNITDCWQEGDTPRTIELGKPFNPTDTWCNNVFIRTGDGNHVTDGKAATSLADLISATAAVNPTNPESIKGTSLHGRNFEAIGEFITGGVANFYVIKREVSSPSSIANKVVGTWKEQTIAGKVLLTFTLPPVLSELGNIRSEERSQFFSVHEGYVRRGGTQLAGIKSQREWVVNDTARDQIRTAFNYDLFTGYTACTSGNVDFDPKNLTDAPGKTAAEFVSAATACAKVDFSATELVDTTVVTDFGFLSFKADGKGVFLGEVGDNKNTVLDFTWSVNSDGHIVINAKATVDSTVEHLRLTLAKIAINARQINVVSFSQEAATEAELATIKGSIKGEVWGLK